MYDILGSGDISIWTLRSIFKLDQSLWPDIAKHFGNSPFIFQNENPSCHVSQQLTTPWKNENDLDCFDWPSQSPDINVIEKKYG